MLILISCLRAGPSVGSRISEVSCPHERKDVAATAPLPLTQAGPRGLPVLPPLQWFLLSAHRDLRSHSWPREVLTAPVVNAVRQAGAGCSRSCRASTVGTVLARAAPEPRCVSLCLRPAEGLWSSLVIAGESSEPGECFFQSLFAQQQGAEHPGARLAVPVCSLWGRT